MQWLDQSIMARKGVAGGKPGQEHTITEAEQGRYHYVYGPFAEPVLTVDPGAVVTVAPVLILFLALQRYYIRGMLAGSVKG